MFPKPTTTTALVRPPTVINVSKHCKVLFTFVWNDYGSNERVKPYFLDNETNKQTKTVVVKLLIKKKKEHSS